MDVNFIQLMFVLFALITGAIGLLINGQESNLPVSVTRTYRYGKYAVVTEHAFVSRFEVPKRWFKHFYEFAAPASSIVLALIVSRYICHNKLPDFVYSILDLLMSTRRKALVNPESTMLAMILLSVHCWKRLYETHCVNIFSDGKINVAHYILGFSHYTGLFICMVGESGGFVMGSSSVFRWHRLTNLQYLAAIVFLLASYEQLRSNYILANLRKDKYGNVVTKSHKIPRGRLFDYITAPLQLTEIIVYAMLSIILWRSSTYHYCFLWVLVNQIEVGILSHQWYLKEFQSYPKERKTIVPYFY